MTSYFVVKYGEDFHVKEHISDKVERTIAIFPHTEPSPVPEGVRSVAQRRAEIYVSVAHELGRKLAKDVFTSI